MDSATKAGLGDTLLGLNPSSTSYLQVTSDISSFAELVSSYL